MPRLSLKTGVGVAALVALTGPAQAQSIAEPGDDAANAGVRDQAFFARLGGFVGVFSDAPERSTLSPSFGYDGQVGWRFGAVGLFATVGQSLWSSVVLDRKIEPGVLNAGLGVEYRFFDGHVRTGLAAGSSTLLFDAAFDDTGTTGYFVELRPAGLRVAVADWAVAELQPLTVSVMRPVTGTPDLTQVEYQSVLSFEVQ